MGSYVVVRPEDGNTAQRASSWCDTLDSSLSHSHTKVDDVRGSHASHWVTSPGPGKICSAVRQSCDLVCYFGHGDETAWLSNGVATIHTGNVSIAKGKAVVSIACKTAIHLGPAAITGGVRSWLGFTIDVSVLRLPPGTRDPIGDAIANGLACLGNGSTFQQAREEISSQLETVVDEFDTGSFSAQSYSGLGYFMALAAKEHVVVHGNPNWKPLK